MRQQAVGWTAAALVLGAVFLGFVRGTVTWEQSLVDDAVLLAFPYDSSHDGAQSDRIVWAA